MSAREKPWEPGASGRKMWILIKYTCSGSLPLWPFSFLSQAVANLQGAASHFYRLTSYQVIVDLTYGLNIYVSQEFYRIALGTRRGRRGFVSPKLFKCKMLQTTLENKTIHSSIIWGTSQSQYCEYDGRNGLSDTPLERQREENANLWLEASQP